MIKIIITNNDGQEKYSGQFEGTVKEWIEILELTEVAQDMYADEYNKYK